MNVKKVKGLIVFFVVFQIVMALFMFINTQFYLSLYMNEHFLSFLPASLSIRFDTFILLNIVFIILEVILTSLLIYTTYESIKEKVNSFRIFFIHLFMFFNILILTHLSTIVGGQVIENQNTFNESINLANASFPYLLLLSFILMLLTIILSVSYLMKIRDDKKLEEESKLDRFIKGFFHKQYFLFNVIFVAFLALGLLFQLVYLILYFRDQSLESFNLLNFMMFRAFSPAILWVLFISSMNYFFEVHHRLHDLKTMNEAVDFLMFNYLFIYLFLSNFYFILRYIENTLSKYDFYLINVLLLVVGIIAISSVLSRNLDLSEVPVIEEEVLDDEDEERERRRR
jgi:hypothetical protein